MAASRQSKFGLHVVTQGLIQISVTLPKGQGQNGSPSNGWTLAKGCLWLFAVGTGWAHPLTGARVEGVAQCLQRPAARPRRAAPCSRWSPPAAGAGPSCHHIGLPRALATPKDGFTHQRETYVDRKGDAIPGRERCMVGAGNMGLGNRDPCAQSGHCSVAQQRFACWRQSSHRARGYTDSSHFCSPSPFVAVFPGVERPKELLPLPRN